jgi:mRNA-degrading endonuclease RelE of RelBE toxin-antitoxin system
VKKVELSRLASKQLAKIESVYRKRIVEALERFAATGHGDVLKLQGRQLDAWRLRVGDYRVIFNEETRVTEEGDTETVIDLVIVNEVGHRRDIYE